jgi:hypothetical protein
MEKPSTTAILQAFWLYIRVGMLVVKALLPCPMNAFADMRSVRP